MKYIHAVVFSSGINFLIADISPCRSGKMSIATKANRDVGLAISVTFGEDGEHKCSSAPIQVDQIGT